MRTFGLDLGTNSLGWAVIETDGEPGEKDGGRIVASGSRIFSQSEMAGRDPKSAASLAVARREKRGMRRRRDRYLKRRQRLLNLLTSIGLMPEDKAARKALVLAHEDVGGGDLGQSVYALRAKALDESLMPHQIGRAIFAIDQRRGFKSNRKADSNDPEQGVISEGVRKLDEQMAEVNARTIGEWLHMRRLQGLSVRARMTADGEGYAFYPSRDALEGEYDKIMRSQKRFHPELLTDAVAKEIRDVVFYQRPLRPVPPGKCSYNPLENRLSRAHPLFQKFRLIKEVNELEIIGEDQKHVKLTRDQRDRLVLALRTGLNKQGKLPFSKLKTELKLGRETRFNKETENRSDLEGDVIYFRMSRPECFGNRWAQLPVETQADIAEKLRSEPDYGKLLNWLQVDAGLDVTHARAVADTPVPDGFGRLGASALTALIDAMENEVKDGFVITEAEAAKRVYGRTNSEADPNRKGSDLLPNYQEVLERHIPPGTGNPDDPYDSYRGRITNPTVHIALNQLRRVVNALIKKHGKPDRIAIEVGRELKMNDREREKAIKEIGKNTKDAQRLSQFIADLNEGQPAGQKILDSGYYRLRLKFWEELNPQVLNRVCIYCGKAIREMQALSSETDVDHILPYSQTLDDSRNNRILCCTSCNRIKRNRAPSQVTEWRGDRYNEILARATTLPKNKQWRFAEDAMAKFDEEGGFLARQLTDMQYISRLALTYLAHLYDYEEPGIDGVFKRHARVRALPGRMTEMLRRNWSLNALLPDHNLVGVDLAKHKNRLDHRHHAIDAIVIACTSNSLIQRLATASAAAEDRGAERVVEKIDMPWETFREDVRKAVNAIIVSHKPDHGTVSREGYGSGRGQTAGKLHNDTAYGYTGEKDLDGNDLVVRRIPITSIRSAADIMKIRPNEHGHSELRDRLSEATRGKEGKAFELAVLDFLKGDEKFKGIRHVRIVEVGNPIWITHGGGKHKKGYLPGGNDRFDVWELTDGRWDAEVVTTFDAHRPDFVPRMRQEHHNARKIMSLKKGDMVAYQDPATGNRVIAIVRKFDQRNKQLYLDPHNEAGDLTRREKEKTYKPMRPMPNPLKKIRPRQVRIDEIGQVFDPGSWWEKRSPDGK